MGNNITQKLKYKESVVKYSYKFGVTKAAIVYCECKRTIYRWRKKYDGSLESLKDKSRRPHHHPNEHTDEEIRMIKNYQYTAIDEYTRKRYLWYTDEHSTYTSTIFVKRLVKYFKFKIKTIQTDNGMEFINRLSWTAFDKNTETMFEKELKELGIKHKLIKPHTPKQNGKVERSHRKDQERFYYNKVFYSLEDLKNRAKYWIREYNNFPMRPLGWLSPKEKLEEYMCKAK